MYNFYTKMEFEFDINKSLSNKEKHGIDFYDAQDLWKDSERIIIPAKNISEDRYIIIAKRKNKLWPAIYTIRDQCCTKQFLN